ncbi:MAG: SDR family oxidoreductase [Dysgonamonadaceae bacterium]|nr:SDR family oxidoreductase [Dysgonamonadaceae bacterium]MDD3901403.1 SDR family oxidoreductase [Dysgonamonadaceae bacterium]
MKIGITGATGHLGRLVVEKWKERVDPKIIVALVRTPEKVSDNAIEARRFNYDEPDNLSKSLEGIDHLLLISGSEVGKRRQQHENVIKAAKQAGVKWIVYTSLLHADKSTISLADEHRATEAALKASGIAHTILRNGWYTENYTASITASVKNGAFIGCAGEGKISSAARDDYAEAAVVVLTSVNQQGKVYELAGDKHYTLTELAAEVSRQTGIKIHYRNLTEQEYAATLTSFGMPDELAKAIAGYDAAASRNDLFDDSKQLSQLIGRSTTTLAQSIKEALI